jgi:dynein heavy chain, axonemal
MVRSFETEPTAWEDYGTSDEILNLKIPCGFNQFLSPFIEMTLQKIFRPDKLLFAIQEYVRKQIGPQFAESPPSSMEMLYKDSDKITPVIFVLSQGADPSLQLIKFANQMNMGDKFRSISLGQG